jgi:hypothetical protein
MLSIGDLTLLKYAFSNHSSREAIDKYQNSHTIHNLAHSSYHLNLLKNYLHRMLPGFAVSQGALKFFVQSYLTVA